MNDDTPTPEIPILTQIAALWKEQVKNAKEKKERVFGKAARQCWGYLGKTYQELYLDGQLAEDRPMADPQRATEGHRMHTRRNLTAEFIEVMVPYVHYKIPNFLVSPHRPPLSAELVAMVPEIQAQQMQVRKRDAVLKELSQWWLEYLPGVTNLYSEGVLTNIEGLGKGMGIVWIEMQDGPYGDLPVASFDSIDYYFVDADAKRTRDAGFIIRERQESIYKIAERFGLDATKLRSQHTSSLQSSVDRAAGTDWPNDPDNRGDIGVYYEIYSRIGVGEKLVNAPKEWEKQKNFLAELGPYVRVCVMEGVPYPLNVSPDLLAAAVPQGEGVEQDLMAVEAIKLQLEWPLKLYENHTDPWPCSILRFRPDCESPYSRPILEPCLPLQKFIDHVYTFLLCRVRATSRDIILAASELAEDVKQALDSGLDQKIVDTVLEAGKKITELVQVIQFPPMNKDLLDVLKIAEQAFEKASGMLASMYGAQAEAADRSARATEAREGHLVSRPDYYASCNEAFMSDLGKKLLQATRLGVGPKMVAALFGEDQFQLDPKTGEPTDLSYAMCPLTKLWMEVVHTDDPAVAAADVAITVEAGSGKRKNKQLAQQNAQTVWSMFGAQAFTVYLQTGDVEPLEVISSMMGEAFDMHLEPLVAAFGHSLQQFQAMQQMQAQQGQPPQEGPPGQQGGGQPPQTPAQNTQSMPGSEGLDRAWTRYAGGPHQPALQ